MKTSRARRSGLILAATLVCVVITLMLATALSRITVLQQRQSLQGVVRAQAQWLAESGVQRAAARLRAAADYRGETWEIPADLLGSGHPAAVTIEVRTTAGDPSRRELHVVSRYPADGTRAATCERTIVLPTAQEAVSSTDN